MLDGRFTVCKERRSFTSFARSSSNSLDSVLSMQHRRTLSAFKQINSKRNKHGVVSLSF